MVEFDTVWMLAALIFAAAALYASVGHGGASGYLAAMALFSLAPEAMKPTALTLNVLVAGIGVVSYVRAGRFSWTVFWPFALASIPFAFLGGLILLPAMFYKPLVGVVLIYAAARFFWQPGDDAYALRKPSRAMVLGVGALLGFVSGLVGVGGGIFLSPLLIFLRWEWVPRVSGVAAAFILVNSLAGLAGYVSSRDPVFPDGLAWWALAAMVGGTLGAHYGAQRLQTPAIKRLLALVLFIAGLKMLAPLTKVCGG